MGIAEGKIVIKNKEMVLAAKELLQNLIDDDTEIVTILKGEDASEEDVDHIVSFVEENYQFVEIEVHDGKQPLYAFIFSIE